jgi:hypothetical protein
MVQPAARAGPSFHASISRGKFHGRIWGVQGVAGVWGRWRRVGGSGAAFVDRKNRDDEGGGWQARLGQASRGRRSKSLMLRVAFWMQREGINDVRSLLLWVNAGDPLSLEYHSCSAPARRPQQARAQSSRRCCPPRGSPYPRSVCEAGSQKLGRREDAYREKKFKLYRVSCSYSSCRFFFHEWAQR